MLEDLDYDYFEDDYEDFYEGTEYEGFYDDLDEDEEW